ncbi:MAG: nucleotidyltransferase domain-containing protein [Candidatus Freyarchaeota archaeon]|nr:nucleotidyltransferase domain-containing protein [Candidatus Jordarchaeia archaeon]MBS7279144.1 nucleotidyltransferase domain-containing protein [Candidatus Jordarchaeia archaeon]
MESDFRNLPLGFRKYLGEALPLLFSYLGEHSVVGVYLFGSALGGELCASSDFDFLVVLSDGVTDKQVERVNSLLEGLEIKYALREEKFSIPGKVLRAIERSTGMFESHFVCRKNDFLRADFSRIFNTSCLMSKLLAPSPIVLGSVLGRIKKLYGEDLHLKVAVPKPTPLTVIKSLAMNLLLSLFSLILYPFSSRANKYEMEAAKWSIMASYYYLKKRSPTLTQATNYLTKIGISKTYLKRLLKLRNNYHNDIHFGLATPLQILKIHTKTLKQKTQTKDERPSLSIRKK